MSSYNWGHPNKMCFSTCWEENYLSGGLGVYPPVMLHTWPENPPSLSRCTYFHLKKGRHFQPAKCLCGPSCIKFIKGQTFKRSLAIRGRVQPRIPPWKLTAIPWKLIFGRWFISFLKGGSFSRSKNSFIFGPKKNHWKKLDQVALDIPNCVDAHASTLPKGNVEIAPTAAFEPWIWSAKKNLSLFVQQGSGKCPPNQWLMFGGFTPYKTLERVGFSVSRFSLDKQLGELKIISSKLRCAHVLQAFYYSKATISGG